MTDEIFNQELTFEALGLAPELLEGVNEAGFTQPTHVQAQLIPAALEGRDILGQSKTGTGKTAAFGLPLMQLIEPGMAFGALVLCPTRELAIQITKEMHDLGRHTKVRVVAIYGGQKMQVQGNKLDKRPEIIVGTPGRVMDFHRRGKIPYDKMKVAVLDEVDRMLDIGFRDDIRRVLGTMRHEHQTIFVSATISDEIEKLARRYMKKPLLLNVTKSKSLTVELVKQWHLPVEAWDKKRLLVHLLRREDPEKTLIFCRMKSTVDALTKYLKSKKIDAHAMHGDMYQGKRNSVMQKLRDGGLEVLVASDLAARGIDVDDITHVINYDPPDDPEVYVHRIGRTARAGRTGVAWTLITPDQGPMLTSIEFLTNVELPRLEYDDFEPGEPPADIIAARERAEQLAEVRRQSGDRTTTATPSDKEAEDASKFPGGVVPIAKPLKRMGGRLRTRQRK